MEQSISISTCVTCGKSFEENYCNYCGEKKIHEKDFKFAHILAQVFDVFTHIDSKLFKSLFYLVTKPGRLALDYIHGRRKPFMKPIQIFFLCNVLFYILLSEFDILLIPSGWFTGTGQITDSYLHTIASNIVASSNISMDTLAVQYQQRVASWSKLGVILLAPAIALITFAMYYKRIPMYAKHLIFGLYQLSFYLLMLVVWTETLMLFPTQISSGIYKTGVFMVMFIYNFFAIKSFFKVKTFNAILSSALLTFLCLILLFMYRYSVSVIALKSLSY